RTLSGLREGVLQRLEYRAFALEQIHSVLREVTHLDAAADRHRAVVRRRRARHQLQQRGFSRAVDTHDAPAFLPPHHEVEPVIDAPVAVGLLHLLQAHHVLARARRRWEIERHGLAALRRLDALDLLQLLPPALHLGRVRRARLEALDEFDFLGEHRLLTLELGLLLLFV